MLIYAALQVSGRDFHFRPQRAKYFHTSQCNQKPEVDLPLAIEIKMVPPTGFEPVTLSLEVSCSSPTELRGRIRDIIP